MSVAGRACLQSQLATAVGFPHSRESFQTPAEGSQAGAAKALVRSTQIQTLVPAGFRPALRTVALLIRILFTGVTFLTFLFWAASPAHATDHPKVDCRAFRTKRQEVPVYKEPDRRSEVLAHLERSKEVCGLGEGKEFVSIFWDVPPAENPEMGDSEKEKAAEVLPGTAGTRARLPLAYVRTVDLWPPKNEILHEPGGARELWELQQNGVIPDDPYSWLRPFLSFFGFSQQDAPPIGGTP